MRMDKERKEGEREKRWGREGGTKREMEMGMRI